MLTQKSFGQRTIEIISGDRYIASKKYFSSKPVLFGTKANDCVVVTIEWVVCLIFPGSLSRIPAFIVYLQAADFSLMGIRGKINWRLYHDEKK